MGSPLLEVLDVSISFGGLQALQHVSLEVPEGSITGLIGPNGAGKTTLFNVISGLLRPDSGGIRLAGEDIAGIRTHRRASLGLARSFQNLGLINDESALVNVMAAQHLSTRYRGHEVLTAPWRLQAEERRVRRRANQALRIFGLGGRADTAIAELPFAEARAVELACVLVRSPRLMLLDEPTTGLDVNEVERLAGVLRDVREAGTTLFVVAHDVRFVMTICDHIYVLSEGQVLADGPPADIQSDPAVIEAYLGRPA